MTLAHNHKMINIISLYGWQRWRSLLSVLWQSNTVSIVSIRSLYEVACVFRSCVLDAVRLSHALNVLQKACRNVPISLIAAHYTAVLSRFPEANCGEE